MENWNLKLENSTEDIWRHKIETWNLKFENSIEDIWRHKIETWNLKFENSTEAKVESWNLKIENWNFNWIQLSNRTLLAYHQPRDDFEMISSIMLEIIQQRCEKIGERIECIYKFSRKCNLL